LVSRLIKPELPTDPIERVEIEAVFSKGTQVSAWRELQDEGVWLQGGMCADSGVSTALMGSPHLSASTGLRQDRHRGQPSCFQFSTLIKLFPKYKFN
jgi:hypothetical protein